MAEQQPDVADFNRSPEAEAQGSAQASDNRADLAERLEQAERKAQEHYDAWLRAKAETDNVRKRAQADVASAHKFALEGFTEALLPVRDSLEAALSVENTTVEALRRGVELTLKQLGSAFDKFNIREINPVEQKFDPHLHQAMTTVVSDRPPNTVVHVLQKGYTLNDRVVRPALVTVSKSDD